jgi:hypothetical protein
MAIQIIGASGSIVDAGAFAQEGLHVIAKPTDHGTLGHYRVSVVTGTLAAALAANAQVFQFKWTDATRFAVITSVRTRFMPLTPFTAATLTDHTSFDMVVVRSYALGGGGTTLTLTGDNNQMRSNMGASLATINVSTTTALTAATTLDLQPVAQSIRKGNRVNPAAATEEVIMPTFDGLNFETSVDRGEHPLVLSQNEGFVIRNRTVWPAAGTGILLIECIWSEVTAY